MAIAKKDAMTVTIGHLSNAFINKFHIKQAPLLRFVRIPAEVFSA